MRLATTSTLIFVAYLHCASVSLVAGIGKGNISDPTGYHPFPDCQEQADQRSFLHFRELPSSVRNDVDSIIVSSFADSHQGWSADEVIVDEKLNRLFIKNCRQRLAAKSNELNSQVEDYQLNWRLLNLRKAGKLTAKSEKRRNDKLDDLTIAAEIASRLLHDKYEVSIDRILTHPKLRKEFDKVAGKISGKQDNYLHRKAALKLRKARKLQPELVLRVADWDRKIESISASKVLANPELIGEQPGIYIFRDSTGYLYVGESDNLRKRLRQHLDESDRELLAKYIFERGLDQLTIEIHAFPSDSKARKVSVRRAYESELIRSRKPRFNIRP